MNFQVRRVEAEFPNLKCLCSPDAAEPISWNTVYQKQRAWSRLAAYFGEKEDLSDSVAFGDSMNDMEVIIKAGIGVAMGNAVKELKEAADYVDFSHCRGRHLPRLPASRSSDRLNRKAVHVLHCLPLRLLFRLHMR